MIGTGKLNLPEKAVYVAKTEDEFPSLVHRAYEENSEELIRERIRFAKDNTWEKRMAQLIDYYNKHDT